MKIDINKKYRTRDGREIIVHATDGPIDGRPVVVSRKDTDGRWHLDSYPPSGLDANRMGEFDLVEVREPREWWIVPDASHAWSGRAYSVCQHGHDNKPIPGQIRVREIID